MSGAFTRLGSRIWDWEPFIKLDPTSRVLWLGLYTSIEAKRVLPGLFHGSIHGMGEAARLPVDEVVKSLDRLIADDMAEYDQRHRVLRLCELPDAGEYPSNPGILAAWWNRFMSVPQCPVRDAHVPLVRWLLDQGARESKTKGGKNANRSGRPTHAHEETWAETFGTVQIPPARRRGTRRLVDSIADTSTAVQPSLFAPARPSPTPAEPLPQGSPSSDPASNDFNGPETVSGTVSRPIPRPSGEGEGVGEGVSSFSYGSESPFGSSTLPSGASGSGSPAAARSHTRPALALVPPVQPYDEVLRQLAAGSGGRYRPDVRDGVHAGLLNVLGELEDARVTSADLEVVARWLVRNPLGTIPGDPASRLSVWVAGPGNVLGALELQRVHEADLAEQSAHLAELKKQLGYSS